MQNCKNAHRKIDLDVTGVDEKHPNFNTCVVNSYSLGVIEYVFKGNECYSVCQCVPTALLLRATSGEFPRSACLFLLQQIMYSYTIISIRGQASFWIAARIRVS
jgi:hypothetical protein